MPPKGNNVLQCPYHKIIHLDATGTYRVTEECESPASMRHKSWFILSPAMEYYYKQKNIDYIPLPAFKPGCMAAEPGKLIEIIYPQPDAKIYVPWRSRENRDAPSLRRHIAGQALKIFWSMDDAFIGTTQNFHQIGLNPAPVNTSSRSWMKMV